VQQHCINLQATYLSLQASNHSQQLLLTSSPADADAAQCSS
jgi:hypothetical protein